MQNTTLALLLVTACGLVGCSESVTHAEASLCGGGDTEMDRQMFERLTANVWNYGGDSCRGWGMSQCGDVLLERDGSYSWDEATDAPLLVHSGSWSFRAIEPDAGVLCLQVQGEDMPLATATFDDALIHFHFEPSGNLVLDTGRGFQPSTPLGGTEAFEALRPVRVPALVQQLVGTSWRKNNTEGTADVPEALTFHEDATYTAEYPSRGCAFDGSWGVFGSQLAMVEEPHACYGRTPESATRPTPRWFDPVRAGSTLTLSSTRPGMVYELVE